MQAGGRGARVAESGGLENRCPGNWTVGSNPTLSAKARANAIEDYYWWVRTWRGGRAAEGAALEVPYTGNCIAGSNPALSATCRASLGNLSYSLLSPLGEPDWSSKNFAYSIRVKRPLA